MDTQSSFDFVRNHLYVDHKLVLAKMQSRLKSYTFDETDVMNWCQEVEKEIGDVESMVQYIEVSIPVDNYTMATLPCNIFKIYDIYSKPQDHKSVVNFSYGKDGRNIYINSELRLNKIYINYVGNPVNKDGIPLIVRTHEMACVYYCLYNSLMEDALLGNVDKQMWMLFNQRASNFIAQAVGSLRNMTNDDWNKLNIIQGNQVPRIGNIKLLNTNFS